MDFDITKIRSYDAIFGKKWSWKYEIHILPQYHILHFRKSKKTKLYDDRDSRQILLALAVQLKSVARESDSQAFGLFLRETPLVEKKEKEVPTEMTPLLVEYSDVFPNEIPKSLPVESDMDD